MLTPPGSAARPTATVLADLARRLRTLLGEQAVLWRPEDVLVYEYDYGFERAAPDLVVLPKTTAQVRAILDLSHQAEVAVVPRGAGTGIAGGAVPREGGLLVSTARMRRIIEIDATNRCAVVQPGVINLDVSKAAAAHGLFFAPDPSSQKASTIGGNIGNNAGGPHCLALGTTTNHVLGVELVTYDGTVLRLGGRSQAASGFDLVGLVVGGEGTLGVVTEATLHLLPLPEGVRTTLAIFPSVEAASEAVSRIIGRGILPSAIEMMDKLALSAIEAAFHAGYPPDAGAVLLVEVDGLAEQVEAQAAAVDELCRSSSALEIRLAASEEARAKLWAARKGAASAMGRIAPNYYLHDTVVPRTRLPEILGQVVAIGKRYNLPIANLFHAGDGNLHPMILFDVREPGVLERVLAAGKEILEASVAVGGTITGEHGVGLEKDAFMPLIFSDDDLQTMDAVRSAFDPSGLLNPSKILPSGSRCLDTRSVAWAEAPGFRPAAPARQPADALWV